MAQTIGRAYVDVLPSGRSLTNFQRQVERSVGSIKLNVDQSRGAFAPLGKISADLNQFQNSLDASVARTLAFGASVGVIGGTVRSIRAVIQSFIEVEKSIADINAVFKLTAPELKGFTSGLFDVARSTAQSFKDVATAATEFSRQGLSVGETLKRTESAMKLVRLAGLETTQAVNVLTAAMNGFSSAGLESFEIVNKLATVDAAYAVSSADLALALSRAGDTAQGAKVSFDELLAAVTAVQQRTARGGAVIGNGLKSIFTRLQRSKVQSSLEDVGVATKDADGNIRESMSILKDYAAVYNTLSDSQRAFTDEQIAGVYQINTLKALVKDLTNEYGVYNGAVRTSTEATDEAEKRMAALSQTTDAKLKRMSASFQEFASIGGEKLFKPLLDTVTKYPSIVIDSLNSAMKAEKRGFGGDLFAGLFEGVGKFLQGPGLLMGIKTAYKLVKFLGQEAVKAAQQVGAIGSQTQKRVQLEQQVLGLLQTDSNLMAQIAAGTINAANGHRLIEASLTRQIQLSERVAAVQKMVGSYVGTNPAVIAGHAAMFGAKPRRMADGYAPALKKEKRSISQGVGGARGGDKPVVIPDFNYGGGKRGPAVAHTGEWFVPHFNGGNAIFNRDMAESYGLPSGAVRVGMASGYVPNFEPKTDSRLSLAALRDNLLPKYEAGSYFGSFYDKFGERLKLQGAERELFTRIYASQSVQAQDEHVLKASVAIYNRAKEMGLGAADIAMGGLPIADLVKRHGIGLDVGRPAMLKNAMSPRWKTPKTSVYWAALMGDRNATAVDAHFTGAGLGFNGTAGAPNPRLRRRLTKAGGMLAALQGVDPRNVQASVFAGSRLASGGPRAELSVVELLDDLRMAEGHIPNFVDFRSSRPFRGDSKQLRIQYRLGDKVPAGQDPRVDMLRDDPYIGRIDKTFKALGLPEPKASIRDFLLDYDSAGKLNSSTGGGVYYPGTGESVIARQGSKASDFLGIVGHEIGGHHLDWSFKDSKRGKSLGVEGPISDDPRFVSKFNRAYKSWQKHGPNAKISPILKHTFSRVEDDQDFYPTKKSVRREVFADMAQFLYGRKSGPKAKRTAIGGLMSSITGAGTFASGYDPLSQAISRESDAVGSGKVRIGTHPSLKAPHNPMGIGVYNSTEGSLSNGIRMARAVGIDPKTKGMAEGHVPNFADDGGSYYTNKGRHRLTRQEVQPLADAVENGVKRAMISSSNQKAGSPRSNVPNPPLYPEQQDAARRTAGKGNLLRTFANRDAIESANRAIRLSYSPEPREPSIAGSDSAAMFYHREKASAMRPTRRGDFNDFYETLQKRRAAEDIEAAIASKREAARFSFGGPDFYKGAKEKAKSSFRRAFNYTEEEQKQGKGQNRFGTAFGAQIAGGLARNLTQGTSLEKSVGAFADGLDIAATALTLIPGPAGMVAAVASGLGTALYGLLKDDGSKRFQAALEKNAMEANRSAQALADVTQSYTAYEAAMQSRDPARMTSALNKLTDKIFKIGEFDTTAMQSALGAIASGSPMEGLANAQAAIAQRQASTEKAGQIFAATRTKSGIFSTGGLGKGGLADGLVGFKEGVSGEQATAATGRAFNQIFEQNDIAGALKTLEEVIDGGAEAIQAILEGGFGGDMLGVTESDKRLGAMQLAETLAGRTGNLRSMDQFVEAMKVPMAEVARTQKELSVASRAFSFELEKATANVQIFSANASRGFEATMNFRDKQFSSSLDTLQAGDRITEREALNIGTLEDRTKITATRDFSRNSLGAEARTQGLVLGQKLLEGGGAGKERGAAAINDLFTRADKFSQAGDTEGLKNLFSKSSIDALGLGGDKNDEITAAIQKSGTDMITKLGVLEADSARNLTLSAKQAELQSKILDANTYMKTIWGKGGTQKSANEITEAIRRIEMARSKGDLTVSEREQLATDLGTVKSESGVSYDAALEKFNKKSLNAAIVDNISRGNTNYIGAQKTASTQMQVDQQVNDIRWKTRGGWEGDANDPMSDFTRRLVEAKDAGEKALNDLEDDVYEAPDFKDVNDGFQAVRTESDKLASAFAVLAQKTDLAKEAELEKNLTAQNKIRDSKQETERSKKAEKQKADEAKIAELLKVVSSGPMNRSSTDPSVWTGAAANDDSKIVAAQNQIKAIQQEQEQAIRAEGLNLAKSMADALKSVIDSVKDEASVGGTTATSSEINMQIRATLADTTYSKEVADALRETLEEKSRVLMEDKIRQTIKWFARS